MMLTSEVRSTATQVALSQDRAADDMRAIERLQRGSKALLIETSDAPKDGYEVRVVNSAQDRNIPPGQIVIGLKLAHRPRA